MTQAASAMLSDVPSVDFPIPLVNITMGGGKVAIKTPPVVNESGFSLSIDESSDVKGSDVTAIKPVTLALNVIEFNKTGSSRFYRLKLKKLNHAEANVLQRLVNCWPKEDARHLSRVPRPSQVPVDRQPSLPSW